MSDWRTEFLDAYRRHRLADQEAYYAHRAVAYERARRATLATTALLLVLAALFGSLSAADPARRSAWAFVAATMSAVATAITTFDAAFGFGRLSQEYRQTERALRLADVRGPQGFEVEGSGGNAAVRAFTADVERLLRNEVDNWSRSATESRDGIERS